MLRLTTLSGTMFMFRIHTTLTVLEDPMRSSTCTSFLSYPKQYIGGTIANTTGNASKAIDKLEFVQNPYSCTSRSIVAGVETPVRR